LFLRPALAHTLGSDETPSSFIPDPSKQDDDESESEPELEVATRSLIFWQDGFSVEDSDLLKYEENQELLQAIQSGLVFQLPSHYSLSQAHDLSSTFS
jgi:UBX domain-containing protein 1